MKELKQFILEKFKINSKTVKSDDQWVLINAPSWSNYDRQENNRFKEIFKDRIFEIESRDNITGGIWMQMVLVKQSELQTIQDIYGYKNHPHTYELPDSLPINASKSQIKKFVDDHNHKGNWNYKELNKIKN